MCVRIITSLQDADGDGRISLADLMATLGRTIDLHAATTWTALFSAYSATNSSGGAPTLLSNKLLTAASSVGADVIDLLNSPHWRTLASEGGITCEELLNCLTSIGIVHAG